MYGNKDTEAMSIKNKTPKTVPLGHTPPLTIILALALILINTTNKRTSQAGKTTKTSQALR